MCAESNKALIVPLLLVQWLSGRSGSRGLPAVFRAEQALGGASEIATKFPDVAAIL